MLNKSKSNKGFTLLELLIAISIFSIVIGLGYTIINKSNEVSASQLDTSKEQQNANLINKYLTKDLEISNDFKSFGLENIEKNNENELQYGYEISQIKNNTENIIIKYTVNVDKNRNEYSIERSEYTEGREDEGKRLDIISNQKFDIGEISESDLPIIINKDENLYNINVAASDNTYKFEVTSRMFENEGDDSITPPPPGGGDGNNSGNIVVDKTENSLDVTINDTVEDGYKPRVSVKKYNNQRSVYLYIDDKTNIYKFTFSPGTLNIDINGKVTVFTENKTENINGESFKVQFSSKKRDVKVIRDSYEILDIDTDGNNKVEIEIFEDTRNEIDIEYENGEVELDIGDDDFSKISNHKSSDKEIEIEIADYFIEDIKYIDITSKNTNFDLDGDGKDEYIEKAIGLNPNNYLDDDGLELEIEPKNMVTGSAVIVDFIKTNDFNCGIQFEGRKSSGDKDVVLTTIPCKHNETSNTIIDFNTHNITFNRVELDFENKKVKAFYGHGNEEDKYERDFNSCMIPVSVKAGNRIYEVIGNKVTIEDEIHINPGNGKDLYKIQW